MARSYFALVKFGFTPQNENLSPKERNESMTSVKKIENICTGQ